MIETIAQLPQFQQAYGCVSKGGRCQVTGLESLPRAIFTAACWKQAGRAMLLVAKDQQDASELLTDLTALLGEDAVCQFPQAELLPFAVYGENPEVSRQRLQALSRLALGDKVLVVAAGETIGRYLTPVESFRAAHLWLKLGQRLDRDGLVEQLVDMGYARESLCQVSGTFALRGGVVDIFPATASKPLRLDFFDDEVDTIRPFDPESQRSAKETLKKVVIPPARDILVPKSLLMAKGDALAKAVTNGAQALKDMPRRQLLERFRPFGELALQGVWQPGMEQLLPLFYQGLSTLTDYLPAASMVVLSEPQGIRDSLEKEDSKHQAYYYELLEAGQLLPSFNENFLTFPELQRQLEQRPLLAFTQLEMGGGFHYNDACTLETRSIPSYQGHLDVLWENIDYWRRRRYRIEFAASSQVRVDKVRELLDDYGYQDIPVVEKGYARGFESEQMAWAVVTERELLGQEAKARRRRASGVAGEKINNFTDLAIGDYVVHVTHGIGIYQGVERIIVDGVARDYLKIQYAGADRLFVPVDQMDLVQKYIGTEGKAPKVYKMGGSDWQKVKSRVRASVQDMAKELLKLYSKREAAQGHACAPDGPWQREFEDAFPFTETPDQLRALVEIKKDMEQSRPMDRLLCGDVGYGKTEIALRAAFKMVLEGKQVAVLVPTTLLAQQHYRTFSDRLAGYPVKVGVLNRFVGAKESKAILKALEQGELDILIGTHRLLSKDIKFRDLGLLVVDEEQRFGVAHKEKVKTLKETVDVLTLTATPIPRTLHMSLVGMRDMSVINTPPEDRLPIQTYVVEAHPRLLQEAVRRELSRRGQVYFIHNRVEDIQQVADNLAELVPEARISVAHGQMKEKELEEEMMAFINGDTDVLVCTTIAEAGLDIPNVNTLIVDHADTLGLAQLYQLRGRVGRSNRQAFAFFTYPPNRIINENAKKRLIAIRDFTELGAGFKIAMRDMEIRGAGNILGPEQHGHIAAVGFDMYCRLVQEEMARMAKVQGKQPKQLKKPTEELRLDLGVNAFVPDDYVEDVDLKIEIYRRIAGAASLEEIDNLAQETAERFGEQPQPVENLFQIGRIKYLAAHLGIISMIQQGHKVIMRFAEDHPLTGEILLQVADAFPQQISFQHGKAFQAVLDCGQADGAAELALLIKVLHQFFTLLSAQSMLQ